MRDYHRLAEPRPEFCVQPIIWVSHVISPWSLAIVMTSCRVVPLGIPLTSIRDTFTCCKDPPRYAFGRMTISTSMVITLGRFRPGVTTMLSSSSSDAAENRKSKSVCPLLCSGLWWRTTILSPITAFRVRRLTNAYMLPGKEQVLSASIKVRTLFPFNAGRTWANAASGSVICGGWLRLSRIFLKYVCQRNEWFYQRKESYSLTRHDILLKFTHLWQQI